MQFANLIGPIEIETGCPWTPHYGLRIRLKADAYLVMYVDLGKLANLVEAVMWARRQRLLVDEEIELAQWQAKEITGGVKDSLANVRDTGEFIVNIVGEAMMDAMNASSGVFAHGEDEFEAAGLAKAPGIVVNVPYVRDSPAALECVLWKEIDLPGPNSVIIGEVRGIHLNDAYMKDGLLDVASYRPLARLGYRDYAVVDKTFALNRPYQQD